MHPKESETTVKIKFWSIITIIILLFAWFFNANSVQGERTTRLEDRTTRLEEKYQSINEKLVDIKQDTKEIRQTFAEHIKQGSKDGSH